MRIHDYEPCPTVYPQTVLYVLLYTVPRRVIYSAQTVSYAGAQTVQWMTGSGEAVPRTKGTNEQ